MLRDRIVLLFLLILLVLAVLILVVGFPHWFASSGQYGPDAMKDYADRVSDLEHLIGVLLALSAIYTVALGLSSWASVQMNLQQAKELIKDVEAAKQKMETLITNYQAKLEEQDKRISEDTDYAREIPNVMAAVALALQRPDYIPKAEFVTEDLRDRRDKHPTDVRLNFYLARAYKLLNHCARAAEVMTWFIEAKVKADEGRDSSVADAYYNRACYHSLSWAQTTDAAQKSALQEKIKEDVWESCRLKQGLVPDMQNDADFAPVLHETWFTDTLAEIQKAGLG